MDKGKLLQALTGFWLGFFLTYALQGGVLFIYSLLSRWLGWTPFQLNRLFLIPIPVLGGISWAFTFARLPLGDFD